MALRPLAYDKYVCCCRFGYLVCSVEMWEYGLWNEITTRTRGKCWPAERIQIKILIYIYTKCDNFRTHIKATTNGRTVGWSVGRTMALILQWIVIVLLRMRQLRKRVKKEQKRSQQAKSVCMCVFSTISLLCALRIVHLKYTHLYRTLMLDVFVHWFLTLTCIVNGFFSVFFVPPIWLGII